jgi:hypothetical protein
VFVLHERLPIASFVSLFDTQSIPRRGFFWGRCIDTICVFLWACIVLVSGAFLCLNGRFRVSLTAYVAN